MQCMRRALLAGVALCLVSGTVGCSLFPHQLQPHQLWKLNRGPAHSQDPFLSVHDDFESPPASGEEGQDPFTPFQP